MTDYEEVVLLPLPRPVIYQHPIHCYLSSSSHYLNSRSKMDRFYCILTARLHFVSHGLRYLRCPDFTIIPLSVVIHGSYARAIRYDLSYVGLVILSPPRKVLLKC